MKSRPIVEIVLPISICGVMNRYRDTMATPLEHIPIEITENHVAQQG